MPRKVKQESEEARGKKKAAKEDAQAPKKKQDADVEEPKTVKKTATAEEESKSKKKKGKEGRHAKAVQGVRRQKESASERAQERHKEGPRVAKGGGARLDGPAVASQVKRALEGGVGQGGRKKEKKAKAGRLS